MYFYIHIFDIFDRCEGYSERTSGEQLIKQAMRKKLLHTKLRTY
jgi:hypothetical protein